MAKNQYSVSEYVKYLNEIGDGLTEEKFIIGGKQYTNRHNYGYLIYTYDPIAFNTGFQDWKREKQGHL